MTPNTLCRLLTLVLSGKGGTGKSLLALLIVDLLRLHEVQFEVAQVDDQRRLAAAIGQPVLSVDLGIARKARKDPSALIKAFAEVYAAIQRMRDESPSLVFEIGATQQRLMFDYARLTDLDDDLRLFEIPGKALVVCVAEPESILQSARILRELPEVLPSVERILVLNQRDGVHADLPANSESGRLYATQLKPFIEDVPTLVMPRIEGGTWQQFEQHHISPLAALSLSIDDLQQLTGLSRPECKVARGDIAVWFSAMQDALLPILGCPSNAAT